MATAPITARPHLFYVRPAPGWLDLLADEACQIVRSPLQKYKFDPKVSIQKGVVKIHRCDWRQGLEMMLRLTTAHDVEWLVLEAKAMRWSEVESAFARVPWEVLIPDRKQAVHVSIEIQHGFTSGSSKLRGTFCRIGGILHVSEGGEIRFKIRLSRDRLQILVSLCGAPLYQRGYKSVLSGAAPLPEHIAAACTKWVLVLCKAGERVSTVYVPFAGTGTFGFEAFLTLIEGGPGSFNRPFSCERFTCTSMATMAFFRRKLSERLIPRIGTRFIFNDFNESARKILEANIRGFPYFKDVEALTGDFFAVNPKLDLDGETLILLNPPFGDRLAKRTDAGHLFYRIGMRLRVFGTRVLGGCICPSEISWRNFLKGLKNPKAETHHFTHGGKGMRLVRWRS